MIEGGWSYVAGAYAVTMGALVVLALVVIVAAARWERRARKLDQTRGKRP